MAPTDERTMTARVERSDAASPASRRKTLWVVQDGGDSRGALALVLAGYGDAWAAIELGRGMGPEHTLFALQPPEDEGEFRRVATLTDLAGLYVRQLRARQPHGPYSVGGYSAGALVALEMARQLRAGGASVAAVYMLDPLFAKYRRFEFLCYRAMELTVAALKPLAGRTRAWKIMSAMVQDRGLQRHMLVLRGAPLLPYDGRVTVVEAWGSRFVRPPTFLFDLRRVALGGVERWRQSATHHAFMRPPYVHQFGRELAARMTANSRSLASLGMTAERSG